MPKKKKLTKKRYEELRHLFVIVFWVTYIVAASIIAFDFSLLIRGGLDDMSFFYIFLAPAVASIVLLLSVIYVIRLKGRKRVLWVALLLLIVAGVYFCLSSLILSYHTRNHGSSSRKSAWVKREYSCAGILGGNDEYLILLSDNGRIIFSRDGLEIVGDYELIGRDDSNYMEVSFEESPQNDSPYYFGEVEYKISHIGKYTVFESNKASRYCVDI